MIGRWPWIIFVHARVGSRYIENRTRINEQKSSALRTEQNLNDLGRKTIPRLIFCCPSSKLPRLLAQYGKKSEELNDQMAE